MDNRIYEELDKFLANRKLGIGCMTEDDRGQITAAKSRFQWLKDKPIWPYLYPLRVVYAYMRFYVAKIKSLGFLRGIRSKKLEYNFSKNYIKSLMPSPSERNKQENEKFTKEIKFSILAPLFNTPEKYLRDMIESVLNQTYGNFELCLADGSDAEHSYVEDICKKYIARDSRIKYKKLEKNLGISENTNVCIDMAEGNYIALFDHDDILMPTALYENMKVICEQDAEFIYTDEATFLEDDIYNIVTYHFKPDFAIDNLRANNYICHFSVFSKALIDRVGKFNEDYDGSQDHDMILRLTSAANKVVHIPKLLYLWRSHKNSVSQDINSKTYAIDAGKRAVRDSIKRAGLNATVESSPAFPTIYKINYEIIGNPKVSIIIPNKDNLKLLANCIDSIIKLSTYKNYEIIVMENNSTQDEIFEYYTIIDKLPNVRVIYYKDKFNYSRINNMAVSEASGEYVLFLNNDIEIITPNWIEEMLMYCQRQDVGAVGAKLFYGNNTVQHAGVIMGAGADGVAIHSHAGWVRHDVGYMGRLYYAQDVSGVTAACMMMKKSLFKEIGGFDEKLRVAYNDVDLCLRIREKNYLIVCNMFAEAFHYESISRGYEEKQCNKDRFQAEVKYMKDKWGETLAKEDPFYNPNVSKTRPWGFGIEA